MDLRARALQKWEKEWEQETREANEARHREWEQERKQWWGERHQQEEGWKKEKEAWEREREELSTKVEQFQQAKESLLSQSKQTQQVYESLRAQNEQIRQTHEQLRQTKDVLLNENAHFRKLQDELQSQNEQMRQAQEELQCHNLQVRQAQQADQLRANTLQDKQLGLLEADIAKTELIRQYQEQEALLQQEIQQCKQEVERVRKGQTSLIAQTSQVPMTPSQQTRVPMGSQFGSNVRPQSTSRESLIKAPTHMVTSSVIDARPLSQVSAKPFQFATPSHLDGPNITPSKAAEGGKHRVKGDAQRSKVLKKHSQVAHKSPSQESGGTI